MNMWLLLLLCYFPIGVLLMLVRLFLTINFFCSQIVFDFICVKDNAIRRSFEKSFLAMLGVVVVQRNFRSVDRKSLLICNKSSKVDSFFLGVICSCSVVHHRKFNDLLMKLLRFKLLSRNNSEELTQIMHEEKSSILIMPESFPSSKSTLFKFSEWPFASNVQVQPMAVKIKRPFPIAGTTLESSWWEDLLWTYLNVVTVYDVTMLPTMHKGSGEMSGEFCERVRQSIADALDATCSSYDEDDIKEFMKRRRFEARRPQEHLTISASSSHLHLEMARQVKEILPHVPLSAIINDIEKTDSVDVTVTNLLEGVVKFTPELEPSSKEEQAGPSRPKAATPKPREASFSKSPVQRHTSLQERKDAFIKQARENYLKKHGLL